MLSFYEYKSSKERYLNEDEADSMFTAPDKQIAMASINQAINQIQPIISNLEGLSQKLQQAGVSGDRLKKTAESLKSYLDSLKEVKSKPTNP